MWLRLGTVTTNSTVDFTIPVDYLSGAGTVTLVADPVAGRPWATPLPVISAGGEIELLLGKFLPYSPPLGGQGPRRTPPRGEPGPRGTRRAQNSLGGAGATSAPG